MTQIVGICVITRTAPEEIIARTRDYEVIS